MAPAERMNRFRRLLCAHNDVCVCVCVCVASRRPFTVSWSLLSQFITLWYMQYQRCR